MSILAVTFTDNDPKIQVTVCAGILGTYALFSLVVGPYRNGVNSMVDGVLGMAAAATIYCGYVYQADEQSQSWVVCLCLTGMHLN